MTSIRANNPDREKCAVCDQVQPCGCDELVSPENALKAVLLFHGGGPWDQRKREEWARFTHRSEATTKSLCDAVRDALEVLSDEGGGDSAGVDYPHDWDDLGKCTRCGQARGDVGPDGHDECGSHPNYDGAPYCHGCGARTQSQCNCGPIAKNN